MTDYPFRPLGFERRTEVDMLSDGRTFLARMQQRRSVREFAPDPVARELIDVAIQAAGTAPSGAHRQPWTFVVVGDPDAKRQIRIAAEAEERENYEGGRLPADWLEALAPLGTDSNKAFLEVVPWIVVLFEQRYSFDGDGNKLHNYYVKESCGIAAGIFLTALHEMGLATLTHTPSPMAFLTKLLGRPVNERPFVLFPVGYPAEDAMVPDLVRKALSEISTDFVPRP